MGREKPEMGRHDALWRKGRLLGKTSDLWSVEPAMATYQSLLASKPARILT